MNQTKKCQYCEEIKSTINIEGKLSVTFFGENFQSRYIICETCLNKLKTEGSLKSKDGLCTIVLD